MKNDKMKSQYRINDMIRVREVRIVGDEGSTVVPTRDALNMAREQGVDLVEISPNANPPVCLLQVPLPAEEAPEGDEGQAGKGGGEGNPLRTSDR